MNKDDWQNFFATKVGKCKVLVIGDIMMDKYYYGDVKKFASDAPVPVAKIVRRKNSLGAAANIAKAMCLEAMYKIPQVRFVAWDVAITEKGPVFIEGNSFPSHAIPQFAAHYPDGIGILPEFDRFISIDSLR